MIIYINCIHLIHTLLHITWYVCIYIFTQYMHVKVYVVHWMSSEKIRRQYFQLSNTGVGHLLPGSTSWERPGLPEFFFVFVETLKLLWFRGSNANEVRKKSLDKDFVWQTFEMGERERCTHNTNIIQVYNILLYIYIYYRYVHYTYTYVYIYIHMQHVLVRRHISGPVWWSIFINWPSRPALLGREPMMFHLGSVALLVVDSPWTSTGCSWCLGMSKPAFPYCFWINIHLAPIFDVQQGTMVLTHSHTCFACFLLLLWCALGNHWECQNPMHAWHLSIDLLLGSPARWTWSAWIVGFMLL